MTTLYLIGNGFDLWHGLPTSYAHFYEFSKETLDEIENYYSFDVAKTAPWCDFENSLGDFEWGEFYDAHNHIDVSSEDFRPSFVYGLEDDLTEQANQHVEAIRECFQEWITGIDISTATRKLALSKDASFITFNYTSTLQSTYGIDENKVLHIHGRAETFEELVFGHGETMEEEPELDENGDSNRTMFSDAEGAAKYPFYALQKPVDKVLETHKNFFGSLAHTREIIVIGHSLNKIDQPYFRKLAVHAPNANWTVCLYAPEEQVHHVRTLVECGVPCGRIRVCTYRDIEFEHHHAHT